MLYILLNVCGFIVKVRGGGPKTHSIKLKNEHSFKYFALFIYI